MNTKTQKTRVKIVRKNQQKSTKIDKNRQKSTKIDENQRKSTKSEIRKN